MYVCQLKDAESAKDPRQLLAQGRGAELSISEEEKSTLEKDIKEQEVLLQGYQKVRERGSGRGWEVYHVLYKLIAACNWLHLVKGNDYSFGKLKLNYHHKERKVTGSHLRLYID